MATPETDGKFDATHQFIIQARKTLEEGGDVDLAGLDTNVAELCTIVAGMDSAVVAPYAKRLQDMMGDLSVVAELLKKRHAEIVQQIEGLNHQKRAASAYSQAIQNVPIDDSENN
jgi:hypothetical protein